MPRLEKKNHRICTHFVLRTSALLFALLFAKSVLAGCEINGAVYRQNGDSSGTYITNEDIGYGGRRNWESDIVTTCDVSQITDMSYLFKDHSNFNQDISAWNTATVTNMTGMFLRATSFNQDLSTWNTAAVTNMGSMFRDATHFNQDLSTWNTAAVTNMSEMFRDATHFNQDLSTWNTAAVTDMSFMFSRASSLTNVSLPKTGAVTNMSQMFDEASSLTNVNLPEISAVTNMKEMFTRVRLSIPSYDALLNSWSALTLQNDVKFHGGWSAYSVNSATARASIIATYKWEIQDGGATEAISPTISSATIHGNSDNRELTVTFSEDVYGTAGAAGDLEVDDFVISISGGTATLGSATPTSITKKSQKIWVLGFTTTGTANGSEIITVVPASSTSIYDAAINAATTTQSNNTARLKEWSQQAYIRASNAEADDGFGSSLSLSADGRTLAVGAFNEDSGSKGINGDKDNNDAQDSGAVYVFALSDMNGSGEATWSQQAYIKASNTEADDQFGHSVSLSADGNTLAVAATHESSNATGVNDGSDAEANNEAQLSGAVYVFTRSGANGSGEAAWSQQAYIKASNTEADDQFGQSVSLSADGNTLAVGVSNEDSGSKGINGDKDNNDALDSGAVYLFNNTVTGWSQQEYIKASNTDKNDYFGKSVSLSADGNTLAAGASNATAINGDQSNESGAVYLY